MLCCHQTHTAGKKNKNRNKKHSDTVHCKLLESSIPETRSLGEHGAAFSSQAKIKVNSWWKWGYFCAQINVTPNLSQDFTSSIGRAVPCHMEAAGHSDEGEMAGSIVAWSKQPPSKPRDTWGQGIWEKRCWVGWSWCYASPASRGDKPSSRCGRGSCSGTHPTPLRLCNMPVVVVLASGYSQPARALGLPVTNAEESERSLSALSQTGFG